MNFKPYFFVASLFVIVISVGVIVFGLKSGVIKNNRIGNSTSALSVANVTVNKNSKKESSKVSLLVTGDIMLGRSVMGETLKRDDMFYPFRKVADKLKQADITFVNLENPITNDCKEHVGGFTFCTTPQIAEGLTFSGVDVVSLANNHSYNYGQKGIDETVLTLTKKGILVTGLGELVTIERGGITFGFLGFEYVFKPANPEHLLLIAKSDPLVDVLIVGVHWGDEYQDKANDFQRNLAREFVESGADVIVGHHPHWVQDSEVIDGVPVFYSLGNFIFDQMWSEETKKGIVVELNFEGKELKGQKVFRTYIKKVGQPEWVY